jgi:uncharacterized protein (TIGR02391 family)
MRWDDIELLQLIHELEQAESGYLSSGFSLMERARRGKDIDFQKDPALLTHELLLARSAGSLTFDDRSWPGQQMPNPDQDPHLWLQRIQTVRLTHAGRDRALARGFVVAQPDPALDDGRLIPSSSLTAIARAICDEYQDWQLRRFLQESGIPDELALAPNDLFEWEFVYLVFDQLLQRGAAGRRTLRTFIGKWLSNQLQMIPETAVRQSVLSGLARHGWHVKDGNLAIGDRAEIDAMVLTPIDRAARFAALHPDVRAAAARYIESDRIEVAIPEAFKALRNRVKQMSGLDIDTNDIMAKAFATGDPPIRLTQLLSQTERDIQEGLRFIFMGAALAIRNKGAHELLEPMRDDEAFEELGLLSMLFRCLDRAQIRHRTPPS